MILAKCINEHIENYHMRPLIKRSEVNTNYVDLSNVTINRFLL